MRGYWREAKHRKVYIDRIYDYHRRLSLPLSSRSLQQAPQTAASDPAIRWLMVAGLVHA